MRGLPPSTGALRALALTALVVAGLGFLLFPPPPTSDAAAAADAAAPWPIAFNVVTPQVGTATHSLTLAWVSEFNAATGSRVRVLPAPNSYARAAWLTSGHARLALSQASDYFDRMDARAGHATPPAGPFDSRVLNVALVAPWGYMVRGDSAITTLEDIRPGVRLAYYSGTPSVAAGIDALLALTGLNPTQVRLVEVGSFAANTRAVVEGRADLAYTSPLSGPSQEAEATPAGIRWLALPREHENLARYRELQAGYLPGNTSAGVASAHGLRLDHAYQTYHLSAAEDPRFVHALLRWLDEHHEGFSARFAHAAMMSIDHLLDYLESGALEPLHEGSVRYLREKGLWRPAWQARQEALVATARRRQALYEQTLTEAARRGITPAAGNAEWELLWRSAVRRHDDGRSYADLVRAR